MPTGNAPTTSEWSSILIAYQAAPYIRDLTVHVFLCLLCFVVVGYTVLSSAEWEWSSLPSLGDLIPATKLPDAIPMMDIFRSSDVPKGTLFPDGLGMDQDWPIGTSMPMLYNVVCFLRNTHNTHTVACVMHGEYMFRFWLLSYICLCCISHTYVLYIRLCNDIAWLYDIS